MTASETNPTIYVEYSTNGTDYTSLLGKTISFNVKDSGILKVAQCELKLWNKGGYFTSPTPPLQNNAYLRVRADVRGLIDTLFIGKTTIKKSDSDDKKETLTVTARGRLSPLLKDYKTYKYGDEVTNNIHNWNVLESIRDAFTHPDSTHDCGVGVEASGTIASTQMKENFDRKALLDLLQAGCEYCSYSGYDDYTVDHGDIKLEPIGTSLANPIIEIPAEPLTRSYSKSIDDLYNQILVWAAPSLMLPSQDAFCEGGVAKGYWTALGNTVISDDATLYQVGVQSVKAINSTDPFNNPAQMKLHFPSPFNLADYKVMNLYFSYYWKDDSLSTQPANPSVTLTDTNGKTITFNFRYDAKKKWSDVAIPISKFDDSGELQFYDIKVEGVYSGYGFWYGDQDFNWNITDITIKGTTIIYTGSYTQVNVDGLFFDSALTTDPTVNTSLQVYDNDSISQYGRSVLNVDTPELNEYAFIVPYANSILAVTKNPIVQLKVTHGAKTWARPNQVVHVASMPAYGLTDWYGRIVDLEFNYDAATKKLHSTFTLTPRYQPITSKEWYKGTLAGLIKYKQW